MLYCVTYTRVNLVSLTYLQNRRCIKFWGCHVCLNFIVCAPVQVIMQSPNNIDTSRSLQNTRNQEQSMYDQANLILDVLTGMLDSR